MILYQEPGCDKFDFQAIPGHFVQVIILVRELAPSEEGYATRLTDLEAS